METKLTLLVICLTFASFVKESGAVTCYECGSILTTDAKCKDPFKSDGVSETTCSGSCYKYKGEKDGVQLVWRTCLVVKLEDQCKSESQGGVDFDVCACNSNLCNAATTSDVSFVTLLAAGVFVVWYNNVNH